MTGIPKQLRADIEGCGLYQTSDYELRSAAVSSPYVDGAKVTAAWAELEPSEGEYAWDVIEGAARPWWEAGKRVLISVVPAAHRPYGPATPEWVFRAGAGSVMTTSPDGHEGLFPVYWDETYMDKFARLVAALGARYDDMAGVEMVFAGVGQYAEVMVSLNLRDVMLRGERRLAEKEDWLAAGLSAETWTATVERMIDMYVAAFPHTLLGLQLCDPGLDLREKTIPDYARHAAERKVVLQNCGMAGEQPRGYRAWLIPLINGFRDQTTISYEAVAPSEEACGLRRAEADYYGLAPGSFMSPNTLAALVDVTLEQEPSYCILWAADTEMGTPGHSIHKPEAEETLRRAHEVLKPGASGPA